MADYNTDKKKKYIPLDKRVYSTPMEARKAADDEDRANLREIRSVEAKSTKYTKTTKSKTNNPKFYGYTNFAESPERIKKQADYIKKHGKNPPRRKTLSVTNSYKKEVEGLK